MLKGKNVKKMLFMLIAMIMIFGNFLSLVYAKDNQFILPKKDCRKDSTYNRSTGISKRLGIQR